MMKVLHSADWHLGAPMTRWGDDARQALASVPGKIASLVRSQNCDLVLLAGDLFDGPPSPEMIRLFCHALEEMAVPVCIAPGNHDYYNKKKMKSAQNMLKTGRIRSAAVIDRNE